MSLMEALRPKAEEPKKEPVVTGRLLWGYTPRLMWDKDDPASVEAARADFMGGLRAGMAAFETVEVDSWYGKRKEEVSTRSFNPEAEQIRMTAQFAGG